MKTKVSPLAPPRFPSVPDVEGVRFATAKAGIKYEDRTDVLFATFDAGTSVAGILTRSKCPSAAVDWCRAGLSGGAARALLVNSGNANAFTGIKGRTAVSRSASLAATAAGCAPGEVMLASTGVIGEPLDPEKFGAVLEDMKTRLGDGPWSDAAKAIMTTDTFAKASGAEIELDGQTVSITGIAKGSGMIAPDMATMLAFIFTDVPISSKLLQTLLERHAVTSFNAITVDGDTSTSDTLLAFATGKAAARGVGPIVSDKDKRFEEFGDALRMVMFDLATQIVRDGEGATKFVTITVQGAVNDKSARKVAFSIANSPLVKTAIAGGDANWGRIVMAVGKAGEPAERDILSIRFGPHLVAEAGERASDYSEQKTSRYMRGDEIEITVGLGLGTGTGTVYTCDLTHAYIDINADYRS